MRRVSPLVEEGVLRRVSPLVEEGVLRPSRDRGHLHRVSRDGAGAPPRPTALPAPGCPDQRCRLLAGCPRWSRRAFAPVTRPRAPSPGLATALARLLDQGRCHGAPGASSTNVCHGAPGCPLVEEGVLRPSRDRGHRHRRAGAGSRDGAGAPPRPTRRSLRWPRWSRRAFCARHETEGTVTGSRDGAGAPPRPTSGPLAGRHSRGEVAGLSRRWRLIDQRSVRLHRMHPGAAGPTIRG